MLCQLLFLTQGCHAMVLQFVIVYPVVYLHVARSDSRNYYMLVLICSSFFTYSYTYRHHKTFFPEILFPTITILQDSQLSYKNIDLSTDHPKMTYKKIIVQYINKINGDDTSEKEQRSKQTHTCTTMKMAKLSYMYLQVWYAEIKQHTKYKVSTCTQYITWCKT